MGTITVPNVLLSDNLNVDNIFYVDGNSAKWGKYVCVHGNNMKIFPPDVLKDYVSDDLLIIVAISRFNDIVLFLDSLENLRDTIGIIAPMICIENISQKNNTIFLENYNGRNEHIPKKIHYMWLGGKNIPRNLQKCIDSWKRYCPDYEIVCWNEDNYDISKVPYMKHAYEAKIYGFVPDYARIDILYQYGGIYLDTDVELVRSLDDLLTLEAFCGVEKWQTVNLGGGSGAIPKQKSNPTKM